MVSLYWSVFINLVFTAYLRVLFSIGLYHNLKNITSTVAYMNGRMANLHLSKDCDNIGNADNRFDHIMLHIEM